VVLQQLYQGPLPHPDMLAKFETLYPGASKLLFEQFKAQGDHRMEREKKVIEGNIRSSRLGQWMAYFANTGGGFRMNASLNTTEDLIRVAAAASTKGARIVFEGLDLRTTEDILRIAFAGKGCVIFESTKASS
jgi:DNA replication protein